MMETTSSSEEASEGAGAESKQYLRGVIKGLNRAYAKAAANRNETRKKEAS